VRWLTGRRIPHSFEGGARKVPSLLPLQVTSQGPGVSLGKEGLLLEQFKAPMTPANHIRYREQKEEDLGWGGVGWGGGGGAGGGSRPPANKLHLVGRLTEPS
jgi:hypothetical protein